MKDPFATRWLLHLDPNRAKSQKAQTDDKIDREIEKIISEARFKSAVAAAKAELIDDLRGSLVELKRKAGIEIAEMLNIDPDDLEARNG